MKCGGLYGTSTGTIPTWEWLADSWALHQRVRRNMSMECAVSETMKLNFSLSKKNFALSSLRMVYCKARGVEASILASDLNTVASIHQTILQSS